MTVDATRNVYDVSRNLENNSAPPDNNTQTSDATSANVATRSDQILATPTTLDRVKNSPTPNEIQLNRETPNSLLLASLSSTSTAPSPTTAPTPSNSNRAPNAVPSPSPVPTKTQTAVSRNDGKITVVDLNSAMGKAHGKDETAGLDFNDADMNQAIDDLFGNGRDPDVITMQEVALKGAVGTPAGTPDIGELKGIQQRLEERTGDTWKMYANFGGAPQYYRSEPGRPDGDGITSSAGTAIFVREGSGSDVETSNAILPVKRYTENGVTYENTIESSDPVNHSPGGSLVGAHVITKDGKGIDIYTSHTAAVDKSVDKHNLQVDYARDKIREYSGDGPVIWTGDFNGDDSWWQSGSQDDRALTDVQQKDGFDDASQGVGNTASKWGVLGYRNQYDRIFTRGIGHEDSWFFLHRDIYPKATAFEAPSSDHKGLVVTVDPDKDLA